MKAIADAIGFNLVVISPTITLVLTAVILLFFTITIESNEKVKQVITISGVVSILFCVFLKGQELQRYHVKTRNLIFSKYSHNPWSTYYRDQKRLPHSFILNLYRLWLLWSS